MRLDNGVVCIVGKWELAGAARPVSVEYYMFVLSLGRLEAG